jgi:hypothetical protein
MAARRGRRGKPADKPPGTGLEKEAAEREEELP